MAFLLVLTVDSTKCRFHSKRILAHLMKRISRSWDLLDYGRSSGPYKNADPYSFEKETSHDSHVASSCIKNQKKLLGHQVSPESTYVEVLLVP